MHALNRLIIPFTVLLAIAGAAIAGPAEAATFTVDRTSDGGGACSDAVAGDCSLRAAIAAANLRPGPDTIIVPAGTYTLTIAAEPPDEGGFDPNAALLVSDDVTIVGAGASSTIVQTCLVQQKTAECPDGSGIARRALATAGVVMNVEIADLTIRHGRSSGVGPSSSGGNGGGVYNDFGPTLTLRRVVLADNASEASGGGVANRGPETLILIDSTVTGNVADNGGGIANVNGGSAQVIRSTISGNAAAEGGGIANVTGGTMTVIASTVSGNTAGVGGGIANAGTLRLANATITANIAGGGGAGGGGLASHGALGSVQFGNSILAGNADESGMAPDCAGPVTSLGNNIVGNPAGCSIAASTAPDLVGVDPRLGPLADNGGPTTTHALLADSPAIDAGDSSRCQDRDQRGEPRPTDGNGDGIAVCDVGAYETAGDGEPGGVTVPLELAGNARFRLERRSTGRDQLVESARFTVPAPQVVDPFGEPFVLTLAEPGCGGVLSSLTLPAGSFQPLQGGTVAYADLDVMDAVTGAPLSVQIRLVRETAQQTLMHLRLRNATYDCLKGTGDRTITLAVTIGDVTAEGTEIFHRLRGGDLVAP
jgi:CSLREA domain-containing protein